MERNMKKTKTTPQILAATSATLIMLAVGFHMSWASPTLPKLLENTSIPVTFSQGSWIVSLLTFGSIIGPLISVVIIDRWGRKTSLLLLSIPLLVPCILFSFAQNHLWYYAGRFIGGIDLGALFAVVPVYLGEVAEDRIRGSIGVLISVMLCFGYLISYCVGPWVSTPVLSALGALIPIVYVSIFIWMPETPHYYLMEDKPKEARNSLEWLRGTTEVDEEMDRIKKTVEFDLQNAGTLRELFTDEGNRKALLIMIGLFTTQQISGPAVILSYATVIFNEVAADISSSVSVIITGVVQLFVSILVVFLADRMGRKTLLLLSMLLSSIFLIGEGLYFHLKANGNDVSGISWLPITAIVGYLFGYSLGLGTVPMALISEIFPCNVKAYATMTCNIYLSLSATFVSQLYPIVSNAYGIHVAFYILACGTALPIVFVFYYQPETKGKSLQEIREMLRGESTKEKLKLEEPSITDPAMDKSSASNATIHTIC